MMGITVYISVLTLAVTHIIIFLIIPHGFQAPTTAVSGPTTNDPHSPSENKRIISPKYASPTLRSVQLHTDGTIPRQIRRQEPRASPTSQSTQDISREHSSVDSSFVTTNLKGAHNFLSLEHREGEHSHTFNNNTNVGTQHNATLHIVESRNYNTGQMQSKSFSKKLLAIIILLIILIASGVTSIIIFAMNAVSYIARKCRKKKRRPTSRDIPTHFPVRMRPKINFQDRNLVNLTASITEKSYEYTTDDQNSGDSLLSRPSSISIKSFVQTPPRISGSMKDGNSVVYSDPANGVYISYKKTEPQLSREQPLSPVQKSNIVNNENTNYQRSSSSAHYPIISIPNRLNDTKPYHEARSNIVSSSNKIFKQVENHDNNQMNKLNYQITNIDKDPMIVSNRSILSKSTHRNSHRISQAEIYQIQVISNKLDIVIETTKIGPKICRIEPSSPLKNLVRTGDIILNVDEINTSGMESETLSKWFKTRPSNAQTTITLLSKKNHSIKNIQRTLSTLNNLT